MSINLGPEAFEAITRLKHNPEWRVIVDAIAVQMSTLANRALESDVGHRVDQTGYVRGLRDLLAHIELIEKPENRNPRPTIKAARAEARANG